MYSLVTDSLKNNLRILSLNYNCRLNTSSHLKRYRKTSIEQYRYLQPFNFSFKMKRGQVFHYSCYDNHVRNMRCASRENLSYFWGKIQEKVPKSSIKLFQFRPPFSNALFQVTNAKQTYNNTYYSLQASIGPLNFPIFSRCSSF